MENLNKLRNRSRKNSNLMLIIYFSLLILSILLNSMQVRATGYVDYQKYHDSFATKFNNFYIEKIRYSPGDTIRGDFDLSVDTSKVTRPMTNASVEVQVFYIASDEHGDYPIYHTIARFFLSKFNVSLLPYYTKHYSFEWTLPKNTPAGKYYIALTSQMASFDIGGHSEVQGLEGAKIYFSVIDKNNTQRDYTRFGVYNITINNITYNPATFIPEFDNTSDIKIRVPVENFGSNKEVIIKYNLYLDSKEKGIRLEDFVKNGVINYQNYPTLYKRIIFCKSHSGMKHISLGQGTQYFDMNLGSLKSGLYVLDLHLESKYPGQPNESLIIKIPVHGLQGRILFQTLNHFPIKKNDRVMIGVGFGNPTTTSALLSSSLSEGQSYTGMLEDLATSFKNKEVVRITLLSDNKVIFFKETPVVVTPLFEAVETGFIARQDIKNAELRVELINKQSAVNAIDDVELLDYNCEDFETNNTELEMAAYYDEKSQNLRINLKTEDNICRKKSRISVVVKNDEGNIVYANTFFADEKWLKLNLKPDNYIITAVYKNQTVKKEVNALSRQESEVRKEGLVIFITYVLMWLLIILILTLAIIKLKKKFINRK